MADHSPEVGDSTLPEVEPGTEGFEVVDASDSDWTAAPEGARKVTQSSPMTPERRKARRWVREMERRAELPPDQRGMYDALARQHERPRLSRPRVRSREPRGHAPRRRRGSRRSTSRAPPGADDPHLQPVAGLAPAVPPWYAALLVASERPDKRQLRAEVNAACIAGRYGRALRLIASPSDRLFELGVADG